MSVIPSDIRVYGAADMPEADSATTGGAVGNGGSGVTIVNKTTGALIGPTLANWAYRLIVKRSF